NVDTKESSPILSESNMPSSPYSQKVGILLRDGFSGKELTDTMKFLTEKGVFIEVISDKLGILKGDDETEIIVDKGFVSTYSVLYDALYVVGGTSEHLTFDKKVMNIIHETSNLYKPIDTATTGMSYFSEELVGPGVVIAKDNLDFKESFLDAVATRRFWDR